MGKSTGEEWGWFRGVRCEGGDGCWFPYGETEAGRRGWGSPLLQPSMGGGLLSPGGVRLLLAPKDGGPWEGHPAQQLGWLSLTTSEW